MYQGDAYTIPIKITRDDGSVVTIDDVEDVEVVIGTLTKSVADGGVTFDEDTNTFGFALTQEDSFSLPSYCAPAQGRVKWLNGDVDGFSLGDIHVYESISKAVI